MWESSGFPQYSHLIRTQKRQNHSSACERTAKIQQECTAQELNETILTVLLFLSSVSHSVLVPLGVAIFPGATRAGLGQFPSYLGVFKLLALNSAQHKLELSSTGNPHKRAGQSEYEQVR